MPGTPYVICIATDFSVSLRNPEEMKMFNAKLTTAIFLALIGLTQAALAAPAMIIP